MHKPSLLLSLLSLFVSSVGPSACTMDRDSSPASVPTAEPQFLARARGTWLYDFQIDGAGGSVWVRDFVTIDRDRHDVSADIFADEMRTTKLFHLEWTATLKVVDRGSLPDTFAVDIRLTTAKLTAFVDDPALWAAFGVDDCKLVVNQAVDVMPTNCVYPLTRNTTCSELELYELREGSSELRPGTPEADHCGRRPTTVDRERAPYLRQPQ